MCVCVCVGTVQWIALATEFHNMKIIVNLCVCVWGVVCEENG